MSLRLTPSGITEKLIKKDISPYSRGEKFYTAAWTKSKSINARYHHDGELGAGYVSSKLIDKEFLLGDYLLNNITDGDYPN